MDKFIEEHGVLLMIVVFSFSINITQIKTINPMLCICVYIVYIAYVVHALHKKSDSESESGKNPGG